MSYGSQTRNPYEEDESPLECGGCADDAHLTAYIDGVKTPICPDCLHDSTFICPDCAERFWSCDGDRVYGTNTLYCRPCAKRQPELVEGRMREHRVDEQRDDWFNRR